MLPQLSDARRRKMFRRAVATIRDPAVRDMVVAAPHKALFGRPTHPVGFVWMQIGPVPEADPPIHGLILAEMLALLSSSCSVILIANDRASRDRAMAYLKVALESAQGSADDGVSETAIAAAIATIPDPALRAAAAAAPCKAMVGFRPSALGPILAMPAGCVWMPPGPLLPGDPPIVAAMMVEMLAQMQNGRCVILVANDKESHDRALAYLRAAVDALGLSADSPAAGVPS